MPPLQHTHTQSTSSQLHQHTQHVITPGFVDRSSHSEGTADQMDGHQTDTACSWLVCHSATVGGTVRGNTVQIVSTYPASPEARPPSFLGKPAVRSRSMAGGAPTPCGRH